MRYLILLFLFGCSSAPVGKVDLLGRDATYAHLPLCSEVTMKDSVKECRIR